MASPKRTKFEIEADRAVIAELMLRHYTHQEIADAINKIRSYNLTRQSISREVKLLLKKIHKETEEKIERVRKEELKKLALVERECWKGWDGSKQDVSTLSIQGDGDPSNRVIKAWTRNTQEQKGDPRYLAEILKIQTRRASLLGLDAPKKTDLAVNRWEDILEEIQNDIDATE